MIFCLLLFEEIREYIYSFFRKKIELLSLSPKVKNYKEEEIKYKDLKENKAKEFASYNEDIIVFDSNFRTIYQVLKKDADMMANRVNFIIKSSPYYIISIFKFLLGIIILIIYFYETINYNNYLCNLTVNLANNIYNNNSFSNNNVSDNSLINNNCTYKLRKCEFFENDTIKYLRIAYFIIFDLPLIIHGIIFLKTFKKLNIWKWYIIIYQLAYQAKKVFFEEQINYLMN